MTAHSRDPKVVLEQLVGLLGHDVKNSTRALRELPVWIAEDIADAGIDLPKDAVASLAMIKTHASRLDAMVAALLQYSRIGPTGVEEWIDVDRVLNTVLANVPMPAGFAVHRQICAARIRMNVADLQTLLAQLIENAVKHHDTDYGNIGIITAVTNGGFTLSVTDDGPGIPDQHKGHVLEPMKTLRPRDEVEGSGMGLAVVKVIVDVYGGRLTLCNIATGRGTRVDVCFPDTAMVQSDANPAVDLTS